MCYNNYLCVEGTSSAISQRGEHQIVMEHNYAEYPSSSSEDCFENRNIQNEDQLKDDNKSNENDGITIKLKYINDDLKLVDGKLNELLGDFKR